MVEGDGGALLFVINRSGYDWEMEVSARGYRPVRVRPPAYGAARHVLLR